MSDDIDFADRFDRPSLTMTPMPMRSAEEQWQIAGYQCGVYATLDHEGIVFVDGKGGRCVMRQDAWNEYLAITLTKSPSVSMLEATADEEAELEALRRREPSHFARAFREIDLCLIAHTRCIADDERDEIVRLIAAKIMPLKEAELRAEEIWREEGPDLETRRRGDVERLADLNENEWLRGLILRAGDFMDAKSSWDECGAIAGELSRAAAFIRGQQEGGAA